MRLTSWLSFLALVVLLAATSSQAAGGDKSEKQKNSGIGRRSRKDSGRRQRRSKVKPKSLNPVFSTAFASTSDPFEDATTDSYSALQSQPTTDAYTASSQAVVKPSVRTVYTVDGSAELPTLSTTVSEKAACPEAGTCIVVKTDQGKLRGRLVRVSPRKKVAAFLGVPYGSPPIGSNRFKPPKPAAKWKHVRPAFNYGPTCFQWRDNSFESYKKGFWGTEMWNANTPLSEDCLYLNVWTPKTKPKRDSQAKAGLAVLVWIYGGGFYSGTSSLDVYDGKWLAATQDVVVVSMNYRVAGLGFLSLGTKEIPGNAGLFDQQLALKWIKKNIAYFGGDPDRVTLFGESSGAVSISLHMMSPGSAGLFKNVILQSASALSPFSILPQHEATRRAVKLADKLGCLKGNFKYPHDFKNKAQYVNVTCMQQASAKTLVDDEIQMEDFGTASFPIAAVVDHEFLKSSPSNYFQNRPPNSEVNVMAGFNLNEGTYFLVYGSPGFALGNESEIGSQEFRRGIGRALKHRMYFPSENADEMMVTFTDYAYTASQSCQTKKRKKQRGKIDEDMTSVDYPLQDAFRRSSSQTNAFYYRNLLDDIVGDLNFVCPTIELLNLISHNAWAQNQRVPGLYLYNFAQRSSENPWPEWMGVMHGYEIEFIFGLPLDPALSYTTYERELSMLMMKEWSNFAKYGDPNGKNVPHGDRKWPVYTNSTKYVNVLGDPNHKTLQRKTSLYNQGCRVNRCSYWSRVFPDLSRRLGLVVEKKGRTCTTYNPKNNGAPSTLQISSSLLLPFVVFAARLRALVFP